MIPLGPIFNLLTEVAKHINFEQANRYADRLFELQRNYEQELAKGNQRDDALIFSIRSELFDLCNVYSAAIKGQATKS